MADVQTAQPKGGKKTALGLRKRNRVGIRVDMTPMVDVAFLLLIFFMVTTVFRRPLAMEMNLPQDVTVKVKESNVMTIYINADASMIYDVGKRGLQPLSWDELRETLVLESDYNPDLVILVKVDRKAKYDNMVNMLDTLDEARMGRFSIVPMTDADKAALEGGGL
jgi:biopolymer transport protein ExbD